MYYFKKALPFASLLSIANEYFIPPFSPSMLLLLRLQELCAHKQRPANTWSSLISLLHHQSGCPTLPPSEQHLQRLFLMLAVIVVLHYVALHNVYDAAVILIEK